MAKFYFLQTAKYENYERTYFFLTAVPKCFLVPRLPLPLSSSSDSWNLRNIVSETKRESKS